MLIVWVFLHIKSLPNLLFGVLCLPGDQSHPFAQPTINPLACCICWAGLLGRAVFPPWNEGPNFGSYSLIEVRWNHLLPIYLPRFIEVWKWKLLSCVRLFVTPWNSPGQNTGVSSLSLLHQIFPTQELNQSLLHCRWILYQLSYQGSIIDK